ncbi:hypothetical protein LJ221_04965 [Streptomyces sp. CNQ085]|nr:hypothetical protein [Streptomyces sp. CNQ085]MCI0383757.1 hypothetical protein [Streptomyces sp. CNQ085]
MACRVSEIVIDAGQTGTESWHVLADPEGNEFCVLRGEADRAAMDS